MMTENILDQNKKLFSDELLFVQKEFSIKCTQDFLLLLSLKNYIKILEQVCKAVEWIRTFVY